MAAAGSSTSYINRMGGGNIYIYIYILFSFNSIKWRRGAACQERWSGAEYVLSVHFWTDAHHTMADMVTEVGNKPVNHGAANRLPSEEAVSYLEEERVGGEAAGWSTTALPPECFYLLLLPTLHKYYKIKRPHLLPAVRQFY